MPVYVVRCGPCQKDQEIVASMKEASEYMPCPTCQRPRPQVFHVPHYTEDRLRFWKGPMGNGYSTALGEQMPASRKERDRLAARKGVEFVSPGEFLRENKEAAEAVAYHNDVQKGGQREQWQPADTTGFSEKPAWANGLT